MILKRIGALSLAKVLGVAYTLIGFLVGIIFSLVSLVGFGLNQTASQAPGGFAGLLMGVGAIIFLPIFYGALGFIVALISASIYNAAAKRIGGIELGLE